MGPSFRYYILYWLPPRLCREEPYRMLYLLLINKNVFHTPTWVVCQLVQLSLATITWTTLKIRDWLINWLIDWLIDWLADWLTGWLIDWLIDWLNQRHEDSPCYETRWFHLNNNKNDEARMRTVATSAAEVNERWICRLIGRHRRLKHRKLLKSLNTARPVKHFTWTRTRTRPECG